MNEAPTQAVELVRSIRDKMYEEIKNLSPERLKAFISREAGKTDGAHASHGPVAGRSEA